MNLFDWQLFYYLKSFYLDALEGRRNLIWASLLMGLTLLLTLPAPWLSMKIIEKVVNAKEWNLIFLLLVLWVAVIVLRATISFFQSSFLYRFTVDLTHRLRVKSFNYIFRAHLNYFTENSTGYIISRVSQDISEVASFFGQRILSLAGNIISFIIGLIFIFYINAKLSILLVLFVPVYLLIIKTSKNKLRVADREKKEKWAKLSGILTTTISSILSVKALMGEKYETSVLNKMSIDGSALSYNHFKISNITNSLQNVIMKLYPVAVAFYAVHLILNGEMKLSELIGFIGYASFIIAPAGAIMNFQVDIQSVYVSSERLLNIWNLPKEEIIEFKNIRSETPFKRLSIDNISFYYSGKQIINNFSLKIEANEKIAIVGKTGSGKSTLLRLIMRFIKLESGEITIDDKNIEVISLSEIRSRIGYISSTPYILNTSILENIRYGNEQATIDDIKKAINLCGGEDFVNTLPEGVETIMSEMGSNFSDGQKQLIILARILLRDPEILLMDEATSSLDSKSEEKIIETIRTVFKDKIVVMVSHRLSSLRIADRLVLLDEGNKIMEGSFDEVKSHIAFNSLFEHQIKK